MDEKTVVGTFKGLTMTAIEKICVLGPADAQEHINEIRAVLDDMVGFWDLPEFYLKDFDNTISEAIMDKDIQTETESGAE